MSCVKTISGGPSTQTVLSGGDNAWCAKPGSGFCEVEAALSLAGWSPMMSWQSSSHTVILRCELNSGLCDGVSPVCGVLVTDGVVPRITDEQMTLWKETFVKLETFLILKLDVPMGALGQPKRRLTGAIMVLDVVIIVMMIPFNESYACPECFRCYHI